MILCPVPIGPVHTCRTAHIFALVADIKMCSIFLEQIRICFLRRSNKISTYGIKIKDRLGSWKHNFFFYLALVVTPSRTN
jgi:hypothetical protein